MVKSLELERPKTRFEMGSSQQAERMVGRGSDRGTCAAVREVGNEPLRVLGKECGFAV